MKHLKSLFPGLKWLLFALIGLFGILLLILLWEFRPERFSFSQNTDNIIKIEVVEITDLETDSIETVLTGVEQRLMSDVISGLKRMKYHHVHPPQYEEVPDGYGIKIHYQDGSADYILENWHLYHPADGLEPEAHSRAFDEEVFEPILELCLEQRSVSTESVYQLWKPEEEIVRVETWNFDNEMFGRFHTELQEYSALLEKLQQLPYSSDQADTHRKFRGLGLKIIYRDGTCELITADSHVLTDGNWYSSENWGTFNETEFEALIKAYAGEWIWAPLSRVDSIVNQQ